MITPNENGAQGKNEQKFLKDVNEFFELVNDSTVDIKILEKSKKKLLKVIAALKKSSSEEDINELGVATEGIENFFNNVINENKDKKVFDEDLKKIRKELKERLSVDNDNKFGLSEILDSIIRQLSAITYESSSENINQATTLLDAGANALTSKITELVELEQNAKTKKALEDKIQKMETELSSVTTKNSELEYSLEEKTTAIQNKQAQLEASQNGEKELQKRITDLEKSLREKTTDEKRESAEIQRLEGLLQQEEKASHMFKNKILDMKDILGAIENMNKKKQGDLQGRITSQNEVNKQLVTQYKSLVEKNKVTKQSLEAQQQAVATANNELTAVKKSFEDQKIALGKMTEDMDKLTKSISVKEVEMTQLQEAFNAVTEDKDIWEGQAEKIATELSASQERLKLSEKSRESADTRVNVLNAEVTALEKEKEKLRTDAAEYVLQLKTANAEEKSEIQVKLTELQLELKKKDYEVKGATESLVTARAEHAQQLENAKSTVEKGEKIKADLEKKIAELKNDEAERATVIGEKVSALEKENTQLKKDLQNKKESDTMSRTPQEEVESNSHTMTEQNDDLQDGTVEQPTPQEGADTDASASPTETLSTEDNPDTVIYENRGQFLAKIKEITEKNDQNVDEPSTPVSSAADVLEDSGAGNNSDQKEEDQAAQPTEEPTEEPKEESNEDSEETVAVNKKILEEQAAFTEGLERILDEYNEKAKDTPSNIGEDVKKLETQQGLLIVGKKVMDEQIKNLLERYESILTNDQLQEFYEKYENLQTEFDEKKEVIDLIILASKQKGEEAVATDENLTAYHELSGSINKSQTAIHESNESIESMCENLTKIVDTTIGDYMNTKEQVREAVAKLHAELAYLEGIHDFDPSLLTDQKKEELKALRTNVLRIDELVERADSLFQNALTELQNYNANRYNSAEALPTVLQLLREAAGLPENEGGDSGAGAQGGTDTNSSPEESHFDGSELPDGMEDQIMNEFNSADQLLDVELTQKIIYSILNKWEDTQNISIIDQEIESELKAKANEHLTRIKIEVLKRNIDQLFTDQIAPNLNNKLVDIKAYQTYVHFIEVLTTLNGDDPDLLDYNKNISKLKNLLMETGDTNFIISDKIGSEIRAVFNKNPLEENLAPLIQKIITGWESAEITITDGINEKAKNEVLRMKKEVMNTFLTSLRDEWNGTGDIKKLELIKTKYKTGFEFLETVTTDDDDTNILHHKGCLNTMEDSIQKMIKEAENKETVEDTDTDSSDVPVSDSEKEKETSEKKIEKKEKYSITVASSVKEAIKKEMNQDKKLDLIAFNCTKRSFDELDDFTQKQIRNTLSLFENSIEKDPQRPPAIKPEGGFKRTCSAVSSILSRNTAETNSQQPLALASREKKSLIRYYRKNPVNKSPYSKINEILKRLRRTKGSDLSDDDKSQVTILVNECQKEGMKHRLLDIMKKNKVADNEYFLEVSKEFNNLFGKEEPKFIEELVVYKNDMNTDDSDDDSGVYSKEEEVNLEEVLDELSESVDEAEKKDIKK